MIFPDLQPMRVSAEPVCIHLFRQNPVFTSLYLRSPVHVVPPQSENRRLHRLAGRCDNPMPGVNYIPQSGTKNLATVSSQVTKLFSSSIKRKIESNIFTLKIAAEKGKQNAQKSKISVKTQVKNFGVICKFLSSRNGTLYFLIAILQSTYRGKGEIGEVYLPSQLMLAKTLYVMADILKRGGRTLSVKWTPFYALYSGCCKRNSLWPVSLRSGSYADIA